MGVPFRYALLKSVQLGNVYHMTLWYLFHKSWTVRKRRPQLCMLSRLGAETQNFRFYTYKFGILESALYGLLLWILVSGLHKLNEWHSLWRPYSWRATFIRNSQNSSFISHYISCMFHMKYLYRISMCDAKKKKRTKKKVAPLLDMVLICTFTQRKICNSNHSLKRFLECHSGCKKFWILGTNDDLFGITYQV